MMKAIFPLFLIIILSLYGLTACTHEESDNQTQKSTTESAKDLFVQAYESDKKGDTLRAAQLYEQACDDGLPQGCGALGLMYATGEGVEQDYAKAAQLMQQGCDNGDFVSCGAWGELYEKGQGVEQSYAQAAKLYEKACDDGNGDASACYNLGLYYFNGQGVRHNYTKAAQLWQQACDNDLAMACFNLGN